MAAEPIDATEEIRPLIQAWFDATMADDDDWFYANCRPEFVYQMGNGQIETLKPIVEFNHLIKDKHYEVKELTGRRYGSSILAFGTYTARSTLPEGSMAPEFIAKYAAGVTVRFSMVWVDGDDGVTRVAFLQGTGVGDH